MPLKGLPTVLSYSNFFNYFSGFTSPVLLARRWVTWKNLWRGRVERNMLFKKIFFFPRPQNKLNLCNQGPKGKKKKKEEERKKQQATTTPIRWSELESLCILGDNLYPRSEGIFQGAHNKAVLIAGSKNNSVLHTAHSSGQSSCSSQH